MHNEEWDDPHEHHEHHENHEHHGRRGPRGRGRSTFAGPFAGPFGPGPWGPGPFGGGPGGRRGFGGRGPRVRRGDVRAAILDLLGEGQPWNGYQIIQEIAARTDGVWRPSAGSVYPALQQLEDEGLIAAQAGDDRRRSFTLTDQGRAHVEAHAEELRASWAAVTASVDDSEVQLRELVHQVIMAVAQVGQAGSAAQLDQAAKVLGDTRRALYRILAADSEDSGEDAKG